jgi:hypothetical protein
MPDETNPLLHMTLPALRDFIERVQYAPYRDLGQMRALLASAFMCGAAIVAEGAVGQGAGKPLMEYGDMLKRRYDGFTEMRNAGGLVLPN